MQAYRTNTAPRSLCVYNTWIRLATSPLSEQSHRKRHLPATPCRPSQRLASSNSQRSTEFRKPRHVEKPAKMSWMDSWSRPSKSQATPAPYYLLPGGESTPYCKTCGRVIGRSCDVLLYLDVAQSNRKADINKAHGKQTQVRTEHLRNTAQVDAKAASPELLTAALRMLSSRYSREKSFLR